MQGLEGLGSVLIRLEVVASFMRGNHGLACQWISSSHEQKAQVQWAYRLQDQWITGQTKQRLHLSVRGFTCQVVPTTLSIYAVHPKYSRCIQEQLCTSDWHYYAHVADGAGKAP